MSPKNKYKKTPPNWDEIYPWYHPNLPAISFCHVSSLSPRPSPRPRYNGQPRKRLNITVSAPKPSSVPLALRVSPCRGSLCRIGIPTLFFQAFYVALIILLGSFYVNLKASALSARPYVLRNVSSYYVSRL